MNHFTSPKSSKNIEKKALVSYFNLFTSVSKVKTGEQQLISSIKHSTQNLNKKAVCNWLVK